MSSPEPRTRRERVDGARLRLLDLEAAGSTLKDLLTATLDLAEELTGSHIGFFHFVEDDQKTLWLQAWSTNTVARMCSAEGAGSHYPIDRAGVWADCVRTGKAVVHDDYPSVPGRKGLPEGHAPVARELTVPVLRAGRARAVLGVGNKPSAYDEEDVADVAALADLAWDIVARKRSEEALAFSEAKYRGLFDSMMDGLVVVDMAGLVLESNETSRKMLGYTAEELGTKTYPELTPQRWHAEEARIVAEQVLPRGYSEVYEKEYVRKDGSIFPVELRTFLVREGGRPSAMWAIVRDITERKQAEATTRSVHEQVQGEKELLSALLASIHDEVWFADTKGRFALANPAGLTEFGMVSASGVSVEELARSLEVFRADGSPRPVEEAPPLRALRGEVVIDQEEIVRTPATGELRTRMVSSAPVKDRDGRSIGAVSVVRDVTEQMRREAALKASEEHFRTLVRFLPIPLALNGPDGRIVNINDRFTQVLGYTLEDIPTLGHWFPRAYPDEAYRREVTERWAAATRNAGATRGEVTPAEYRVTTKAGAVRTMLISGVPVGENLLVTFVDVTEARALQAQVAMASRLAAMGTLVAGVAHEVNNPLAAEMADQGLALEIVRELRERLEGSEAIDRLAEARILGDAVEALEEAQEGGLRIARVVKNLSTFGRPDPRRTRIRLGEVVAEALRWVPASVARSAVVQVEDGGAPDVVASIGQLEQVVVNLVTNAAKAIPPGRRGLVVVRTGAGEPGMSRLEVIDDGKGIPPDLLERIFEPFFTTRPTGEGRGMGLGLAICHAIVTAHGGTLSVTSTPGRGSTFRMELPAAPAEG